MPVGVIDCKVEDFWAVNDNVAELADITRPIYERLGEDAKDRFEIFLSHLYNNVAEGYKALVEGNLLYITEISRDILQNTMWANDVVEGQDAQPEMFCAISDLLYSDDEIFLKTLSTQMQIIYGALSGTDVKKTLDDVEESCEDIKGYLEGFKRDDVLYTTLFSIYLNSAKVHHHAMMTEDCWDKDIVKRLATNTLASILPINETHLELERLVADDRFLDMVYKNMPVFYEKVLAKVDKDFKTEDNFALVKKLKELEEANPTADNCTMYA